MSKFSDVRCTRCGGTRLVKRGKPAQCSFIGCPAPLHDFNVEKATPMPSAARRVTPTCEHSAQSYEHVCTECHIVRPRDRVQVEAVPPLRHTVGGIVCVTIPADLYDMLSHQQAGGWPKAGPSSGEALEQAARAVLADADELAGNDQINNVRVASLDTLRAALFTSKGGGK